MLEARKITSFLEKQQKDFANAQRFNMSKELFIECFASEQQNKNWGSFKIDTAIDDAVSYGFIQETGLDKGYISTTPKGRNLLKPYGIGWLHFAEDWLAQFKTIGAFTLGIVALGIINLLILIGKISLSAFTSLHL